jgi:hypothetical protein
MPRNARWRPNANQTPAQRAIANRLVELDSDPFDAARRGNLPRTYIYEVLTGKKRSFSGEYLSKVADALQWRVNEVAAILAGNGATEKAASDPVDRASSEAAFEALVRILRPDLAEELPVLVQLFATLALERDVFGLNRLGFPNRAHSDSPC